MNRIRWINAFVLANVFMFAIDAPRIYALGLDAFWIIDVPLVGVPLITSPGMIPVQATLAGYVIHVCRGVDEP